jgi:hypothetical protein
MGFAHAHNGLTTVERETVCNFIRALKEKVGSFSPESSPDDPPLAAPLAHLPLIGSLYRSVNEHPRDTCSASFSTFCAVPSTVSLITTVLLYVFPYRSHPLNNIRMYSPTGHTPLNDIRNFIRCILSTPASSHSLKTWNLCVGVWAEWCL